jgi:type I restriction enzyme S subunit
MMGITRLMKNLEVVAQAPGGVAKLRGLALSMAVRGELVPQNPSDEPAKDLLERIGEKRTKIGTRRGTSTEVSEATPRFSLPESWLWVRLEEIASYIQRGKGPRYVEKSGVPVVSQKCVQWTGFSLRLARFVDEDTLSKYAEERFLQPGDLLWNSTGTGTIGRVNVYPDLRASWPRVVVDSHVTVIRPLLVDSRYLWCWLASPFVQDEIEHIATGTTKQQELGTGTVRNYSCPLPPIEEQERIVSRVDEIVAVCDELEKKLESRRAVAARFTEAEISSIGEVDRR